MAEATTGTMSKSVDVNEIGRTPKYNGSRIRAKGTDVLCFEEVEDGDSGVNTPVLTARTRAYLALAEDTLTFCSCVGSTRSPRALRRPCPS